MSEFLSIDINYEYYKNYTLANLDNIWSEFYSEFNKERGNSNFILNDKHNYFIDFLNKFEKDWPLALKEINQYNDQSKINADLFLITIKNLIKIINQKDAANNYNIFKNLLSKIELSELLK